MHPVVEIDDSAAAVSPHTTDLPSSTASGGASERRRRNRRRRHAVARDRRTRSFHQAPAACSRTVSAPIANGLASGRRIARSEAPADRRAAAAARGGARARRRAPAPRLVPPQRLASNVASACGSGVAPRRRASANSGNARELALAVPRSLSDPSPASKSVKNRNGVLAAHSCPMNSSGVIGDVSRSATAARHAAGSAVWWRRSPNARFPIWS